MTKATAIHIAVLLLCSSMAAAQDSNAPPAAATPAAEAASDEIQKVVIVSTGSRGAQRTVIDAPVPVDILNAKELTKSGQYSLDKALGFRVPSFNTVQTPVNDATSMLDPYEIRNLGPSRALILINGKRKNSSALVYAQTSPGRGESGADISAIPADAIKRIEVLRDGASAQYGSDAIAGVVNIILKDHPTDGAVTMRAGITGKGDGEMAGVSLNDGVSLNGRGFVNYTIDLSKVHLATRAGPVSAAGEADTFGANINDVNAFLALRPDAGNINGSPKTKAGKFLVNSALDLSDTQKVYANMAYVRKDIYSYANYRTPYWQPTDYGLLHKAGTPYLGYGPTLNGKLTDYNGTIGFKTTDLLGWTMDTSVTIGGNEQQYQAGNTVNHALGAQSPTSFNAGGVEFYHTVYNADLSKQITDKVNLYMGTELRWEQFNILAGDPASYFSGGADSYAGNQDVDSFQTKRENYGAYLGAVYDITDRLLVDVIGRYEHYSDFGNATVGKISSRFKLNDKVVLRGSLSSGFRAPSLHQIYTQKAQYSFVAGEGIKVSGLVNNVSPAAVALGVDKLKAEKSRSLTLGLGVQPDSNTSMTLDFYRIDMKDRIVLGNEIFPTGDPTNQLDIVLAGPPTITSLSYFSNALDSTTSGVDYVFSRKNLNALGGKLTVNLSGNYTIKNERVGDVHNIDLVSDSGQSVLDATQEALIFTSRPKHKNILGLDLDYNKINFSLNNTVFGPTTFRQAGMDANLETRFKTRTVTDLALNYQINDKMTFTFNINNLFDITPKWEFKALNATGAALLSSTSVDQYGLTPAQVQRDLITFNGRYPITTYDGSHFSQLGRMFNAALNVRF